VVSVITDTSKIH